MDADSPSHNSLHTADPGINVLPCSTTVEQRFNDPSATVSTRNSIEAVHEVDGIDEQSPLLPPRPSEDVEPLPQLDSVFSPSEGSENILLQDVDARSLSQKPKSSWYLFLLTLSMFGLQFAWSVELSYGSPYLLSLGISKSLLAFVWIAGPLSGTLVQPYVGIKSDRCRSRFGKRRPFMIGGGVATVTSLLALAWTPEVVGSLLHLLGAPRESKAVTTAIVVFAVVMIYVLDFAINVIQAGIRAFIVDNAPAHQQESANAWAVRLAGAGNITGYLCGYVDLPAYSAFVVNGQFKILCVLASVALSLTLSVSCLSVKERDARLERQPDQRELGVLAFFRHLYQSVRRLPPQIKMVCQVQFFAWIGWFPFLFYITTYISEIYAAPFFSANPHMTSEEIAQVWQKGTRVGTFALFMFGITSFLASVLLPFTVARPNEAAQSPLRTPMTAAASGARSSATITGLDPRGGEYFNFIPPAPMDTPPPSPKHPSVYTSAFHRNQVARVLASLPSLEIEWLTLPKAWLLSHALFAVLMFLTFFVNSTTTATILVSLLGIPWAMTNWAPFALIASEISQRNDTGEDATPQAGVVLGIHNVAIAAPQVIATLVSSAIFRTLQKPRGSVGDQSVAWVLRSGGLAAVVACWLTRRVGEGRPR